MSVVQPKTKRWIVTIIVSNTLPHIICTAMHPIPSHAPSFRIRLTPAPTRTPQAAEKAKADALAARTKPTASAPASKTVVVPETKESGGGGLATVGAGVVALGAVGVGAAFVLGGDDDDGPEVAAPPPSAPSSSPPPPPSDVSSAVEAPPEPTGGDSFEDEAWDNYEKEVEKIKRELEAEQRAQEESMRELREKAKNVLEE